LDGIRGGRAGIAVGLLEAVAVAAVIMLGFVISLNFV
jgi:hypothetical protein